MFELWLRRQLWRRIVGRDSAHTKQGIAYGSKGEYDCAIRSFDQALQNDTYDVEAYANRGVAYAAKGEYDRAIQDYDQALRLDPNDAPAYHSRGLVYVLKGEHNRARSDFNRALALGVDMESGFGNACTTARGFSAPVTPRTDRPDRDPNQALAYNYRGVFYAERGAFDHAIQDFDQALRLDPNYVEAYVNRGLSYTYKGKANRAIQDFDQALQLAPNYVEAYVNRGMAYTNKGEYDHAMSDFYKALALGYDRNTVEAMLEVLPWPAARHRQPVIGRMLTPS